MADVRVWNVYRLSRIISGLVLTALLSVGCAPSISLFSVWLGVGPNQAIELIE
jgi:hypothetical protein